MSYGWIRCDGCGQAGRGGPGPHAGCEGQWRAVDGDPRDTLDLDDVVAGHPVAEQELAELRVIASLTATCATECLHILELLYPNIGTFPQVVELRKVAARLAGATRRRKP